MGKKKFFIWGLIMILVSGRTGYDELEDISPENSDYKVICKAEPIKAAPGDNVTLPCWVCPEWDAFEKTVEWSRLDQLQDQPQDSDKKYVLVDKGSGPDNDQIIDSYKGRVTLCYEDRKTGNVSLNITNVNVSDTGWYKCFLPALNKSAEVWLDVASNLNSTKTENQMDENKGRRDRLHVLWGFLLFIFILFCILLYNVIG